MILSFTSLPPNTLLLISALIISYASIDDCKTYKNLAQFVAFFSWADGIVIGFGIVLAAAGKLQSDAYSGDRGLGAYLRDGDGVELCVMESVSPASNPRQTWSKAKQAAFDDEYAARPAAIYPYKRKHWFEVAFRDEPAVQKAPPFGSVPTDFRPEED